MAENRETKNAPAAKSLAEYLRSGKAAPAKRKAPNPGVGVRPSPAPAQHPSKERS